jgi:hypothetical protein
MTLKSVLANVSVPLGLPLFMTALIPGPTAPPSVCELEHFGPSRGHRNIALVPLFLTDRCVGGMISACTDVGPRRTEENSSIA